MKPQLELISKDGRVLVFLSQVIFLKSDRSYTEIHYYDRAGKRQLHEQSKGLTEMETYLDERFVRLHRSIIVNRNRVEGYTNDHYVYMETGEQDTFSVPKEKWEEVRSRLRANVIGSEAEESKRRKRKDRSPPTGQLEIPFG